MIVLIGERCWRLRNGSHLSAPSDPGLCTDADTDEQAISADVSCLYGWHLGRAASAGARPATISAAPTPDYTLPAEQ